MTDALCLLAATLVCATPAQAADEIWRLKVHLLSDDERVELRRLGDGATMCRTPCDTVVHYVTGDEFVLDGPGISPSSPLFFHPRNGEVTLRVAARPLAPRKVAGALMAVGLTAFALGAVAWLPTGVANGLCDRGTCSAERTAFTVVETAVVGGLISAAVGLVLFHVNPPTRFSVEP